MNPGGQYIKGANRERARVKWHLQNGATWAVRAAGSHSTIDVAALYPARKGREYPHERACVVLEQIKCGGARTTGGEESSLLRIASAYIEGVVVSVVTWPDRQMPSVRTIH